MSDQPAPIRAGRSTFSAAAAVALYTAAAFGVALYGGSGAATACLVAAVTGVVLAFAAGVVVRRTEEAHADRGAAQARLDEMRALAEDRVAPPPLPAPDREMRESREIQASLLPDRVPQPRGYHLDVAYEPCGELGGDFYDFLPLHDGRLLLTLGDVSGKGPPGAIVMAMVQTLIRVHQPSAIGPADLLSRVNAGFAGTLGKGVFVTALAGLLDPRTHRLTLAGAGHHPLLLLNAQQRRTTQVAARGLALGLVRGREFENALVETTIDLARGDSLLLYTDGATEGADEIRHGTGENRFLAAAAAAVLPGPRGALARLTEDLGQGGGRVDDTTLLLVAREDETKAQSAQFDRTSHNVKA